MSNLTTPLYNISIPGSNIKNLWAKMENENPTGTHKDRSLGPWIEYYANKGEKELVISSSGNSAISAAKFCAEKNIKLYVFVGPNIDKGKLAILKENKNVVLRLSKTPKKDAIQFLDESNMPNLRASTDDKALIGYEDIAFELIEQLPKIDNIFIPTSSGATLVGIYFGLKCKMSNVKCQMPRLPALYAIQTTKIHPIASYFDKEFTKENSSHATAIVDNIAHRRDRVIKIIEEAGGGGFVISNKQLEQATELLRMSFTSGSDPDGLMDFEWQSHAPSGAWQSVLAFAGFLKWRNNNPDEADKQISVCLFTD